MSFAQNQMFAAWSCKRPDPSGPQAGVAHNITRTGRCTVSDFCSFVRNFASFRLTACIHGSGTWITWYGSFERPGSLRREANNNAQRTTRISRRDCRAPSVNNVLLAGWATDSGPCCTRTRRIPNASFSSYSSSLSALEAEAVDGAAA
jgi:hypothetical protein